MTLQDDEIRYILAHIPVDTRDGISLLLRKKLKLEIGEDDWLDENLATLDDLIKGYMKAQENFLEEIYNLLNNYIGKDSKDHPIINRIGGHVITFDTPKSHYAAFLRDDVMEIERDGQKVNRYPVRYLKNFFINIKQIIEEDK